MCSRIKKRAVLSAVALFVSLGAASDQSQAVEITRQTLDRVDAFNATAVLEMAFDDVNRTKDFINLGIAGTNFSTCKLTAIDGIFCLAGKVVRNWPDTEDPLTFVDRLSCNDPALGLDTKKIDTCTGMTVDLSGAIWLAGKKSSTHSLIKVVGKAAAAACPSGWTVLSGSLYCAKEFYAGRPLLVDIDPIDGDVGAAFKPCPSCAVQSGILGLEERKTAVFFPDPKTSSPIVIASGKGWNLIGNEQLLSSALLQVPNGNSMDNFVLVTTTSGRILAKRTDVTGTAIEVFNIPLERVQSSAQCAFGTQQYGIRTSSKSGRVYVTDRNYCQVLALVPNAAPFTALINDGDGQDLTLSTSDSSGTYPPSGPTLAPGISIDLADCRVNCTLLTDDDGIAALSLVAVRLANGSNSGATLFQIKGIPDCRYADEPTFPVALIAVCDGAAGVIVDPDNVGSPAAQLLNVTPLLPKEVRSLFDNSGVPPNGLPPLLISRQYRAQERTDFVFEAFFAVTEAGVRFRDTFTAEFDVPVLEGVPESLGCLPDARNLLAWDVTTTVSEIFRTVDVDPDVPGAEYVDMLTNVGCGTVVSKNPRLSLLPYNLEIAPDTYGPTILSTVKSVTTGNDAVFARLVQSLYDDLEYVRRELACQQVDAGGGPAPPLSASVCNTLSNTWQNGKLKLDKCVSAAFQPKQSAGDENCQSFVSQLTNFRASLPATTSASDVANRLGELKMRVDVIRHVFDTRFLPSIPAAGFCRERNACPP
jgi:DNA-binding beta-propeller fold protein YncE